MRGIGKAAVILSAMVLLAGCGIYEEQKNVVVQSVTAAFLQRTTPLTQGAFKKTATVAPQKTADQPVESVAKPQVVEPMKEPISKCTCETRRERRERRG
jgi:hypothetical protein